MPCFKQRGKISAEQWNFFFFEKKNNLEMKCIKLGPNS
jgi:hypothetical protein